MSLVQLNRPAVAGPAPATANRGKQKDATTSGRARRDDQKTSEEVDVQLAELQALDAQRERLEVSGQPLAAERVALALASYQACRGDLAAVLAARREAVETQLRLTELDTQRAALRVRLTTLIAEQ
jgi:hypothetical protein